MVNLCIPAFLIFAEWVGGEPTDLLKSQRLSQKNRFNAHEAKDKLF